MQRTEVEAQVDQVVNMIPNSFHFQDYEDGLSLMRPQSQSVTRAEVQSSAGGACWRSGLPLLHLIWLHTMIMSLISIRFVTQMGPFAQLSD